MKKLTKLATLFLSMAMMIASLSACSIFSNDPSENGDGGGTSTPQTITVHYYDDKSMTYTSSAGDKSISTNFIAPAGKIITGLFDENDVQYAAYDCVVDLKNNAVVPSDLYAKYEEVDISYLNDDPLSTYDEDPQSIGFYSGRTTTWEFNPTKYPDDQKMISACLCNPYADLTITVTFYGKNIDDPGYNEFYSKLIICDETVGSIYVDDFGSSTTYAKKSYTATIKAKQLTNGNYKLQIKTSAKYGSVDYIIKNYRIDFAFSFDSTD